jgi:hypothetical protein
MNCEQLQKLVGMSCSQIGDAVEVCTPFSFADGDPLELFAQTFGPQVLFFDDGFTLQHLHDAGIRIAGNRRRWAPIRDIAAANNVTLTDDGVLETLCAVENPSQGFARMISTLLGIASWEREQAGVSIDAEWFVQEVAFHLQAWKPEAPIIRSPKVKGFSGRTISFDFEFDGQFVDAVTPHSSSTGAELRKVVDLVSTSTFAKKEVLVIVDDRFNPDLAKLEMGIIGRVAKTWGMSSLVVASGADSFLQ